MIYKTEANSGRFAVTIYRRLRQELHQNSQRKHDSKFRNRFAQAYLIARVFWSDLLVTQLR